VVKPEAEILHRADRDCVIARGVRQYHRLLAQAANGENGRLGLIDDRRAEFPAEDAGVVRVNVEPWTSSGISFLVRARLAKSWMALAS